MSAINAAINEPKIMNNEKRKGGNEWGQGTGFIGQGSLTEEIKGLNTGHQGVQMQYVAGGKQKEGEGQRDGEGLY